jgi:hypothetical protein
MLYALMDFPIYADMIHSRWIKTSKSSSTRGRNIVFVARNFAPKICGIYIIMASTTMMHGSGHDSS